MEITSGLMPRQVLQRDAKGLASAAVSGKVDAEGPVFVRVEKNRKPLRGFAKVRAGKAKNGAWTATIRKLPVGGPYTVTFRVGDKRAVAKDILVGDVWILAGQSNMEGIGRMRHAFPTNPMVRCFYMWDEWDVARDPLHVLAAAVDRVHCGVAAKDRARVIRNARTKQVWGVGPGMPFALEMFRRTGVPQGLIACAHGGTSMGQWSPKLKSKGAGSLYGATLRRCCTLGQPVAGVLWYQGESDAGPAEARAYTRRMKALVAASRKDLGQAGLPWVIVQLGRLIARDPSSGWNSVREQQRLLPDVVANLSVVPAVDLELDDGIHIGGLGHAVLGPRLARAACHRAGLDPRAKDGIRLRSIRYTPPPKNPPFIVFPKIELTFDNVAGSLCCGELPAGFALVGKDGDDLTAVVRTELNGSKVVLEVQEECVVKRRDARLVYGLGLNPYCNVHDEEGMGLPTFGPLRFR